MSLAPSARPTRCAIYLRQSLDLAGDRLAVTRQREDCQKIAQQRGWTVVAEYVDNSISASDKRMDRPGYNDLVQAFSAGEFDALVCYDLDRLTRQPRQLEDWIDAAQERGLLLVTANGEADLSTDGGRLFARIKASVARAEVERKSARQKRAALQRAEEGRPPSGVRLTGYSIDGKIVKNEADLVRSIFHRFLTGDSLKGIAAWLNASGQPTRNGHAWNPSTLRSMLVNPRYAGLAIYCGESTGRQGSWPALVDETTYALVRDKITDPRRRTQVGTDRKHLGSGLFLCGVCDRPVRSHSGGRYRCPAGGHVTRLSSSIDAFILAVLRGRLAQPDLADVLHRPDSPAAQRHAEEVTRLRDRLAAIEGDYDGGLIDGRRYKIATDKIRAELANVERKRIRSLAGVGAGATLSAPDPVAAFDASPLGAQRTVLDALMTVRLLSAARGHKFAPETVVIEWSS
ncbi:recombinase family protein [uncultured Jatrophihabitans sp.]|uniref:recombinase family protein n=1 Tax=uncultured Jatrophihabitans sp. TaxID=1610747 RepID=UPI0035CAF7F0